MTMVRDWKLVWVFMWRTCRNVSLKAWLGLMLLFVLSAALLLPSEQTILAAVQRPEMKGLLPASQLISVSGEFHYFNLVVTGVLMLVAYRCNSRRIQRVALSFFMAGALAGVFVQVLKPLVGRPRPSTCVKAKITSLDLAGPTLNRRYYAYPSGHSATTVAGCTVLAIAYPRLILPCILFSISLLWARLHGNNHFPIDILHGAIIGVFWALMCTRWIGKRRRYAMRCQPIYPVNRPVTCPLT